MDSIGFLQTVIDEIPDCLMVIDRDHRVVLANRAVRELADGRDPASEGLPCYAASHQRDTPCIGEAHPCPLAHVTNTKSPVTMTHTHYDAHGEEVLVEISAAPIFDAGGEVVQIVESCRDITARVRAENESRQRRAELAHVERLSTMGEMAADLAHELSQPLAAIINYIQACVESIEAGEATSGELLKDLEQAAEQAERAGNIIEHVRAFVRKGSSVATRVDLNQSIRVAVNVLALEVQRSGIQPRMVLGESLPDVRAVPIQIQQVIVNLVQNGLEAMGSDRSDSRALEIRTTRPQPDSVECAVRDWGCGLSDEVADRLFEPFYTTKTEGVGMGLSISRTIIEAHGGTLRASNNPDRGATFRFTLPVFAGDGDHDC